MFYKILLETKEIFYFIYFLFFISIFLIFLMEVELGHHHANTAQGQRIWDSDNKENVYFKIWINLLEIDKNKIARLLYVLDWGWEAERSQCWSVVWDTKSSLYNSSLQLVQSALKDRPVHCGQPTHRREPLWASMERIRLETEYSSLLTPHFAPLSVVRVD